MPLVLGLASSHAPPIFAPSEKWPRIYSCLTQGVPQPREATQETPDVIQSYLERVGRNFCTLSSQLEAYRPDALIMIGDDQNEVFAPALIPALAIYLGEEASGTLNIAAINEPLSENRLSLKCHSNLANFLLEGVIDMGFDVAYMRELKPTGRPEAGLGHAFIPPAKALKLPDLNIPAVIFFVNAYHPPLPSAKRCYDLGGAIRKLLDSRPERVAIYASGGLSHDPRGPRAGWIDQPLDRWVLERLARGEGQMLTSLFTFDSDALRGGTGEIRSWIVVAGALESSKATIVDYFPAYHAVTGIGFAYWTIG